MEWKLGILESVSSTLSQGVAGSAILTAAAAPDCKQLLVVGLIPLQEDTKAVADTSAQVQELLPYGIHALGLYSSSSSSSSATASAVPKCAALPAVAAISSSSGNVKWEVDGQAVTPEVVPSSPATSPSLPGFIAVRCHADVELQVCGTEPAASALQVALQQLETSFFTPQLVFLTDPGTTSQLQIIPSTTTNSSSSKGSSHSPMTAATAAAFAPSGDSPSASVVPLSYSSSSSNGAPPTAPMFEFKPEPQPGGTPVTSITLGLDVLVFAAQTLPLNQLSQQLLIPALKQQLSTMVKQLSAQPKLLPLRAFHFQLLQWAHPISICYPQLTDEPEANDLKLTPVRQQLHGLLGLPGNMPLLRQANALVWPGVDSTSSSSGAAGNKASRLLDVHASLPAPGFEGSTSLISGSYEYCHYMQDRFNDAGWGCAYRSLQTIITWFRQQGYTKKPVPTHREIQQVLVKLGDKDPSFIGSSKWIGAVELGFLLDEYLGVMHKILRVDRGSDIPSLARQLAAHFQSQGTPVMIGGGVLAYTLLGVHFNDSTGECAFLILDPHYTGGEDLKKIHQGGWVAWKKPEENAAAGGPLFVKDAFYNFMCPQRPNTV